MSDTWVGMLEGEGRLGTARVKTWLLRTLWHCHQQLHPSPDIPGETDLKKVSRKLYQAQLRYIGDRYSLCSTAAALTNSHPPPPQAAEVLQGVAEQWQKHISLPLGTQSKCLVPLLINNSNKIAEGIQTWFSDVVTKMGKDESVSNIRMMIFSWGDRTLKQNESKWKRKTALQWICMGSHGDFMYAHACNTSNRESYTGGTQSTAN